MRGSRARGWCGGLLRRFFLAAAALSAAACGGDWTPSGSARVLGWHDAEVDGIASCVVFLEVTNVGAIRIERSSLSFRVYTAERSYYRTLVLQTPLPPGGVLFAQATVDYADPGESAETDGGVELVDAFFE